MSYNKDYNNIIGQYDGSTISERTGLQIGGGLGIGTVNLTNGSSTGTVNDVTITNTAGTSIGRNTNNFNLATGIPGYISIIDLSTGDIYVIRMTYNTSSIFNVTITYKIQYSTGIITTTNFSFSGPTGTYQYYIGALSLNKSVNSNIVSSVYSYISNDSFYSIIAGGTNNIISTNCYYNFIIAGNNNSIIGTSFYSSISSGYNNIINIGSYSSILGGDSNNINNSDISTIISGSNNIITGISNNSSILGGDNNNISSTNLSVILNGEYNNIINGSNNSAIVSGSENTISAGSNSIIIGGNNNYAMGSHNVIAGGYKLASTTITYASGQGSIVLGLSRNSGSILGVMSSGDKYSSILGGNDNYIGVNGNTTANSTYNATIIGSQACAIYQSSTTDTSLMIYTGIYGGNNSYIRSLASASNLRACNIIGAENSNITNNTGAQVVNNCLLNTNNVTLQNTNNTTVIGQTTTTTITESDIVYIGKEIVGGKVATTVLSAALSNTTSTIYSNIISFNAKAGAVYRLRLIGTYQTAATTTGIKVRMSGTAVANVTGYMAGEISAVTGATGLRATIASMTAELITTGVSAINTPHAIDGDIIVRCTTAGTVILQMASEVNGSAAQLNIGTAVIVERVI